MNVMKTYKLLAVSAALVMLTTGCEHKDLCYDHTANGHVTVVFDWRNAPDANPETMSIYLYPKSGGSGLRYDFVGRDGGTIEIAAGEYVAVCVNSDLHYTYVQQGATSADDPDDSPAELYKFFEVTSDNSSVTYNLDGVSPLSAPRARGTEDERVAMSPEPFWTDVQTDITVRNISDASKQVITLYPKQSYCKYTVNLQNVENIDNVYEISATISGMAGGYYIARRSATNEVVTVPFAVSVDTDNASAQGEFNTFGHCPGGDNHAHTVLIYVIMKDGTKYYTTVDVTDQVHNAPDPYNVVISIDNLPLPSVITGGQSVSVEEWENFVIDVIL
jgi:hypothetical protein